MVAMVVLSLASISSIKNKFVQTVQIMVYCCCDCKKTLTCFSKCFGHNPIFDDPKIMAGKNANCVVSHELAHITKLWAS